MISSPSVWPLKGELLRIEVLRWQFSSIAQKKMKEWYSFVDKYTDIFLGWNWANEKNVISFALSPFPVWITGGKSKYSRQLSTGNNFQWVFLRKSNIASKCLFKKLSNSLSGFFEQNFWNTELFADWDLHWLETCPLALNDRYQQGTCYSE